MAGISQISATKRHVLDPVIASVRCGNVATAASVYAVLAIAATWPLLLNLRTGLAGDLTDPWQTLWGFWWLRHYREFGPSPSFATLLWWPHGAPLWFQTWDIPSAAAQLVTARWMSEITS